MSGFIYIWHDTIKSRFYLGSHYGSPDDGYVGSGTYFKRAYNKRPTTFKRRIIQIVNGTKDDLLQAEQLWLNLIEDAQLGKRYYNLKKVAKGGSVKGRPFEPLSEEQKEKLRKPKANTDNYKRPKSETHKKNISNALKASSSVNNRGNNNPKFSGISNEEFRAYYINYCVTYKHQPSIKVFGKWFKEQTGKSFPLSLSSHRFNHGKDLFLEVELSFGVLRKSHAKF